MNVACQVVIPLTSGRTRDPWPNHVVPDWLEAVCLLFGGYSPIAINVTGKWRKAAERETVPDQQNRYEIAVSAERVPLLREFLRYTCALFEQECLYFKVGDAVEYLPNPLGWPPGAAS